MICVNLSHLKIILGPMLVLDDGFVSSGVQTNTSIVIVTVSVTEMSQCCHGLKTVGPPVFKCSYSARVKASGNYS